MANTKEPFGMTPAQAYAFRSALWDNAHQLEDSGKVLDTVLANILLELGNIIVNIQEDTVQDRDLNTVVRAAVARCTRGSFGRK